MSRALIAAIVPTERHVESLTVNGVSALTLRKLVRELASAERPELSATTPEVTRLLTAEHLGLPIAQAAPLDDAVGRLRRNGATAEILRATGQPRGARFADLLRGADEMLARRALRDDREAPWLAAARLTHTPAGTEPFAKRVVVRGLTRWDASTLALFQALHAGLRKKGGEGLCLELPRFDVAPLGAAIGALAGDLERRWADANDAPNIVFEDSVALAPGRVGLVEAYDAESEARAAARAVLEGMARGIPLDRIAVVPVDLAESFLEPLRFELARARIPFAEPRGRPARAAPRAHAALELLQLARGPLGRDELLDVLRVPGVRLDPWLETGKAALGELSHELSRLPLRLEREKGEILAELADRVVALGADDPARAERVQGLQRGLARWLSEIEGLAGGATRAQHAARARDVFAKLGLFSTSPQALRAALARAFKGEAEQLTGLGHDAVAAAAVETAIERTLTAALALGLSERSVSIARWLEELELALEGVAPTRGAAQTAALRIARPDDVAGLELGLVVLCRASDASVDRAVNIDAALGGELESALPNRVRPPTSGLEQHFRIATVAAALSRAEQVVVTWSRHDGTSTLAPSRLARALAKDNESRREPASSLAPSARRVVARRPASSGARARSTSERQRAAFYANPGATLDELNGAAGDLSPFFAATPERPLAVTALERGLRCPFLAFSNVVLRAARADPVGDAIGVRERGSLLHEALARALEATQALQGNKTPVELVELGSAAARELLERRGRSALRRVGLESTLADVRAMLTFVYEQRDGFVFLSAEQAFGDPAAWGPLVHGRLLLSGRIDRIDKSSDGRKLRVIDYKTRGPKLDDTLLQPWLYALKAGLELGAEEVEFCFLSLEQRNPRSKTIYAGAPQSEAVHDALARAEGALLALSTGRVPARPASPANCQRCDARDICRRPLSSPAAEGDE
jgi:ATP-dependent helicase/nuclease subunit B